MLWDSIDAIRAVAGPDYETAVIPEKRRKYLICFLYSRPILNERN